MIDVRAAGVNFPDLLLTRGFAAHRRAAMAGHAGWPLWSSFGRKPGA